MITEDKAIEIFCLEERFSRLFNKMKEKCSVIPSNPTKRRCLCDSRILPLFVWIMRKRSPVLSGKCENG